MENEKYNTESHMEMFYVIVDNNREFIKENTELFYNFFMSLKKGSVCLLY